MALNKNLNKEVRELTTRLGEVIYQQEGAKVFQKVEDMRIVAKQIRQYHKPEDIKRKHKIIASLKPESMYSVLHAFSLFFQLVNLCEERARRRAVTEIKDLRHSLRDMFSNLKSQNISSRKIQQCLKQIEIQPVLTAHPTESKRRTIQAHLMRLSESFDQANEVLEALWQTREARDKKMSPLNEAYNCLFYFEKTIFESSADFMNLFESELKRAYPKITMDRAFFQFGSWVGGDRDGNPFVTPETSLEVVRLQNALAVKLVRKQLKFLLSELSHASEVSMKDFVVDDVDSPFHVDEKIRRQIERLLEKVIPGYTDSNFIISELKKIQKQLVKQKAIYASEGRIKDLIWKLKTFGLHLAHLDFRDHSSKLTEKPDEIIAELKALKTIQKTYGEQAAHRFILSMTHSKKDILNVLALAQKANSTALDVIPLFETVEDLQGAPELLKSLFKDPQYRTHLKTRNNIQEIMLGYSDSNKDGSYLTANWQLYQTQKIASKVADQAGIVLRLFHGKGGTIDRGGGVTHRSLMAQPHAAHGARIRITEQGEVISLKYADSVIARRNFEQLTSGVIESFCFEKEKFKVKPEWEKIMEELAKISRATYRNLIYETPEFLTYFWSATPIDVVSELKIGSRPSSRSKSKETEHLRAIPWVFSWTQSRHMLSAWYGIGSALSQVAKEEDDLKIMQAMYKEWPYFSMLMDNAAISLAKTDLYIASQYATLVEDEDVRHMIFSRIEKEYQSSTRLIKKITGHSKLLKKFPRLAESIALRNPYVDPLHYFQVRLLADWRKEKAGKKKEFLSRLLAITVNGIAFGMKSTG